MKVITHIIDLDTKKNFFNLKKVVFTYEWKINIVKVYQEMFKS